MALKSDFLIALTQLAAERHLPKEEVLKAIEAALVSAFKKDSYGDGVNIAVKLNPNTGEIQAHTLKTVVEVVEDDKTEIRLTDALNIRKSVALGDELEMESLSHQASRIAAQTAKQVVLQRLREAEREMVYEEFAKRVDDIISGVVGQSEIGRGLVVELDRAEAILPPEEQVPTERYRRGQRLKVYAMEVNRSPRGPEIIVSRRHSQLLRRLFELEVPEVYNGIVEIRSIAREAGSRSKVAVIALQDGVDPIGSCIGMRGNRIQNIVNELQGEKIDVVRWDRDLKRFISNALSPAEVVQVVADEDDHGAVVVVPERQLSLAIGKEGQNARLAAKLTGWRLDIKSMAEWEAEKAQIKLEAQAAAEAEAKAKEEAEKLATEQAVAEAEERALEEEIRKLEEEEAAQQTETVAAPVLEEVLEEILAQEEAAQEEEQPEEAVALQDELDAFTLDDVMVEEAVDEEEEEEPPFEEMGDEIWEVPQLTPDAGKIRFAEDILDFDRGGREGRGRRGRGRRRAKARRR
jgi:N utilization substance protein A